jgi:hypothetical protein
LCGAGAPTHERLGNQKAHDFGNVDYLRFPSPVNYTDQVMSKSAPKSKAPMEALVNSFSDLVEDARKRMSPEEFRQAEKEFDKIVDRAKVRASRGGRRETA